MPVVLGGHQTLPLSRHNGDMVRQRVAADEDTAGMDPRLPDGALQRLRKLDGL